MISVKNKRISKSRKKSVKSKKSKKSRKSHSNKRKNNKKVKNQKGGENCSIASVKESGLTISPLGDIAGLSIPEQRSIIYRPNCKADTYQAMMY